MLRLVFPSLLFLSWLCTDQGSQPIHGASHFSLIAVSSPDAPRGVLWSSELQELILIDLNRGVVSRLTNDECRDQSPCLSSDGKRVIFSSGRPASGAFSATGPQRLFLYDLESGKIKPIFRSIIAHLSDTWEYPEMRYPLWGQSTGRIAFAVNNLDSSRIAVYDLAADTLFLGPPIYTPVSLCWSPDERYIAFDGYRAKAGMGLLSGKVELGLGFVDLATGEMTIIDSTRGYREAVDWTPNGHRLLIWHADSETAPKRLAEYVVENHEFIQLDTLNVNSIIGYGETENDILYDRSQGDSSCIFAFNLKTKQSKQIGPQLRYLTDVRFFR